MTTLQSRTANTGFEEPTDPRDFERLLRIVEIAEPWIVGRVTVEDFRRAFLSTGYMFRTPGPRSDVYFSTHVDNVNALLVVGEVDGNAVYAAIRAHSDIPLRLADKMKGQLLEAGLNPWAGVRCSNRWREILKGSPLTPPVPSERKSEEVRVVTGAEPYVF